MADKNEADFESALEALEEVVQGLEKGDLSLADQIKEFERGIELSKQCKKMLDDAKLRVKELTSNAKSRTSA